MFLYALLCLGFTVWQVLQIPYVLTKLTKEQIRSFESYGISLNEEKTAVNNLLTFLPKFINIGCFAWLQSLYSNTGSQKC